MPEPTTATQIDEPKQLLAVVEAADFTRYFRWSYDSHTVAPWQLMGAVHVHDEEPDFYRWSDLPAVRLVSEGVPMCGCGSCGGWRG